MSIPPYNGYQSILFVYQRIAYKVKDLPGVKTRSLPET